MLPNFNPFTVSSEPGQNLGTEALAFVQSRGAQHDNDDNPFDSDLNPSPGVNADEEPNANICFCFVLLAFA
jgi:hypothetical protein